MFAYRSARGRLVAVAAALAVLVTLFPAVGSAAAVEACPTTLPSSGYKDLAGLSAETIDAIDCITHYGIAQGVSSTNFSPTGGVSRWQMALFLVRMADDLGIELPSSAPNQFTDISVYPAETQRAINQLAQLGITSGVSNARFDPTGEVSRWQMALFLTRLHVEAGFSLPNGAGQGFGDISTYPAYTQMAINQLAQLGVAKGTTTTTFSPEARVLRWQMALFLSRELQATGAAPYEITVTADPKTAPVASQVNVTVTVLTPDGRPVVGRLVDVFVGSLDGSGRCVLDADAAIGTGNAGTGSDCKIDRNDPKTDSAGKVNLVLKHNTVLETNRIFAWIGSTDQAFDSDFVATYAYTDVIWTASPTAIVVPAKIVKFGTKTTVTGWLVDSKGNVVAAPGLEVVVTVSRGSNQIISHSLVTGSNGQFSFSYTGPSDPDTKTDSPVITDTVKAFWDKDGDGKDDGSAEFDVSATITWDDETPRADTAVLTQNTVSTVVGQSVTVTATVTDKFGQPIKNAEVVFVVTGANASDSTKVTNSSGIATFTYTATSAGTDTIDATVDVDGGGAEVTAEQVADLTHYTVVVAPDLAGETTLDVVAVNTSDNTVDVTDGANHYRLRWDSTNDTFTVNGKAKSMADFETALSGLSLPAVGKLVTNPYSATTSGASSFILTTG